VASEGGGLDGMARDDLARDRLRLIAALRVDDRDLCAFPGERMTDALSEPAIAAGHQRDRAFEIHLHPPCHRLVAMCGASGSEGKRAADRAVLPHLTLPSPPQGRRGRYPGQRG